MQFFNTTTRYKEMVLLEHIEKNTKTTQKEMANVIEGAVSMVNTYLDNLESKNYIIREYISKKIVHYNITPKGTKRKQYLQISYVRELMDFYLKGQDTVSLFLDSIKEKQFHKILLYGAGDVANIILNMVLANKLELDIVGIIDDNLQKVGTALKNIKIVSLDEIDNIKHDGIVISSYNYEEEIVEKLEKKNYPKDKIIKYFER